MNDRMELDLDRLEALLEAYGADPERWPAAEREPAVALLARSAEARAMQREAARLDRMLDLAAPPTPSPELLADILAGASVSPWRRWAAVLWPFGPIWKPASALVLAGLLGVATGLLAPSEGLFAGAQLTGEIDNLLLDPPVGMWSL